MESFSFKSSMTSRTSSPNTTPEPSPSRNKRKREPTICFQHKYCPLKESFKKKCIDLNRIIKQRDCHSFEETLGSEILDLIDFLTPNAKELESRKNVVERVANVLKQDASLCRYQLFVFGSSASGLCFSSSDIDLCLVDPSISIELEKGQMASKLSKVARKLRKLSNGEFIILRRPRIPLIKYKDKISLHDVDVSFQNTKESGFKALETIQALTTQHPELKPLIMIFKLFLLQYDLNQVCSGGVGGYPLTIWISNFLKLHSTLYPHRSKDMSNFKRRLGSLFIDFMHFFGNIFDYHNVGFDSHGRLFRKERPSFFLCLYDPNASRNDLASGSHKIQALTSRFRDALDALNRCHGKSHGKSQQRVLNSILKLPTSFLRK